MSKLLFLRSYLMIILLIISVGWGLDKLLSDSITEQNNPETNGIKASFLYIESVLMQDKGTIETLWNVEQKGIQVALGFPVTLLQINDFFGEQHIINALESGEIITLAAGKNANIYYKKLRGTQFILALEPLNTAIANESSDGILIWFYYLLVAIALYIWLWPLSRDLHELRKTAIDFGAENFAARVKINKSSSITPVATAFNSMAQRIQELIISHQDLTNAVSHELKTPLSRFKFSLEIVKNSDDKEQRQKYLQAMKQDVCELDELIDEMLNYAKLGTHNLTLTLQRLNAEKWLKAIIESYSQKEIKIILDTKNLSSEQEKYITIDKHLMSRAIHNLIRNGLRYANQQLKIHFKREDKKIYLAIEDDGEGISKQFREQVFQPFARLESSRDKQSGGYGLGLAITQKIVQQHGGSVAVDKSTLGGARFKLSWVDIGIDKI